MSPRAAAALCLFACGGCLAPEPPPGNILCAPAPLKPCPDGYLCASDGTCRQHELPDLATTDAPPPAPVHVTVVKFGAAAADGLVATSDRALDCGQLCELDVPVGTRLTLHATSTPKRGVWFSGFGGAGCDARPDCTFTATADVTIPAQFDRANYAFVSSTFLDLPFGTNGAYSLLTADGFCQGLAHAASLPGTFVAWLSIAGDGTGADPPVDALTRVAGKRGWLRPDELPFADLPPVGGAAVYYPPRIDETGVDGMDRFILTGTDANGHVTQNCDDFSSTTGAGAFGRTSQGAYYWGAGTQVSNGCLMGSAGLYCFGVDYETRVVPPPGERLAFVSSGTFSPLTGLAAADALCQSDAAAAGLASPMNFFAALDTTLAATSSRFDLGGAPWSRTDGVLLSPTPLALFTSSRLFAPLDLLADGVTYEIANAVWTGGPPNQPAAASTATCNDWSATGINGLTGNPADPLGGATFNASELPCSFESPVFCLQN